MSASLTNLTSQDIRQRLEWEAGFSYNHHSHSKTICQSNYFYSTEDQVSSCSQLKQQFYDAITGFEEGCNFLNLDSNQQFSIIFMDSQNLEAIPDSQKNTWRAISSIIHEEAQCFAPTTPEQRKRMKSVATVDCSICHTEEAQGVKLGCSHSFHLECLNPWLSTHNTCPTCRTVLKSDE